MDFTVEKIEKQLVEIRESVQRGSVDIPRFRFAEGLLGNAAADPNYDDSGWADFNLGETWGGYDITAWFRAWVPVPKGWREQRLALQFIAGPRDGGDSTAEAMLYVNGQRLQGIDIWHEEAWLPPDLLGGERIFVALKAWSGVLGVPPVRRFKLARLVSIDETTDRFYQRCRTLLMAVKVQPEDDLRRIRLLQVLNEAFHRVDFIRPRSEEFYRSIQSADAYLSHEVNVLEQVDEVQPTVVALGHAHIDMAWLWRLKDTREKAARTFTTALHLMRQYPEYRFVHSSPQLYRFLEQDYPDLFAQVKARVAAGQWEITGGMWVEADCNLTGGESLIRQFLLGRAFIHDRFGVETKTVFLPDVFGFSASLPQIILGCGMTYFLTSKISWNQTNRFPHDTFHWRGIDGSQVLTHFVTTPETGSWFYTYNGALDPQQVKGCWDVYRQKDINDEVLMLFGWGDGGGGPTREMLENGRSLANLPGIPRVTGDTVEAFFARLEKRLAGKDVPVWDGELYLEYHRGTYTSQAAIKRSNRQAETLYHNAEWLSALAAVENGVEYPAELLRRGWELILLNQFHDILPGSSIHPVYEDSARDYVDIMEFGETALDSAASALTPAVAPGAVSLVVFNPLSWTRGEPLSLPLTPELEGHSLAGADGKPALTQRVNETNGETGVSKPRLLVEVEDVPPLGWRAYPLVTAPQADPDAGGMEVSPDGMQNDFFQLRFDRSGRVISLLDRRAKREVLSPGGVANIFQVFEDRPLRFDAWDIDLFYQQKMDTINELVEAEVEERGPLRAALRLVWRYHRSTITQRVTLYRRLPRIDFRTEVDWREQQTLLKTAFPVDIRARRAAAEIQFGWIERPTHRNTSWDAAMFETPAHRWIDLSESDYGVALLNDSKYGYDIKDNVMRLTLIKSAVRPDPLADKGRHQFTYSLFPHAGALTEAGVIRAGYALNNPLFGRVSGGIGAGQPAAYSFAAVDAANVIIETVKQAEGGGAWIVRLYEAHHSRRHGVTLSFGRPLAQAWSCNLVEEGDEPIPFSDNQITFDIRPFEIKTFKVRFR